MDLFTFVFTVLISFLGILFGTVLTHYTKEEVLDMKQLIPFLQFIILAIIFVVMYIFFPFDVVSILVILSFGFIYLFWHKNNLNFLDYIVFSMILVISSLNSQAHMYVILLIFLFGILSGALFYIMHTKHKTKKTKKLAHHIHSGKHLLFHELTSKLFSTYKFFFFLAIITFIAIRFITSFF